jgi:hypothetical protein
MGGGLTAGFIWAGARREPYHLLYPNLGSVPHPSRLLLAGGRENNGIHSSLRIRARAFGFAQGKLSVVPQASP